MKKSLTVTFVNNSNYGAFLQAFALQKLLGKSNNIANTKPLFKYLVSLERRKKNKFLWRCLACCRLLKFKRKVFFEAKKMGILKKNIFRECLSLDANDVYICGSDQVWNPNFIAEREKFYFLDFAPEGARRISYAASLGVKSWPKPFEERILPMLKKFDAISVREESSVPYLTSLGLKNVVCVCDPTILHTGSFYRNEFPYEKSDSDFTFVYRIREEIPESVRSIFCKDVKEVHLQKRRTIVSVTEWLQNIDCAKFVVTDSFHCAVFCILFHKPFLVIPNRSTGKGMNERFSTLLGKTGLEYRCLTCEESHDEVLQKLNAPVDWEKVDAVLEEWRTYSANWLRNALGE